MTTIENIEIKGDLSRQAIDSLRGYQYQILASARAWIALKAEESLFLEVAEDYAIATSSSISRIQVKDTTASITLNSQSVIDAINTLFVLRRLNPGRLISLRYLTTSTAAVEQAIAHRVAGEGGIAYWGKASIAADVAPLKARLLSLPLSDEALQFIADADDASMRGDFLRRIVWDCGQPNLGALKKQLSDALILYGESKNISSTNATKVYYAVVERVLTEAAKAGRRELNRADFLRLFDEHTRTDLPTYLVEQFLAVTTRSTSEAGKSVSLGSSRALRSVTLPATRLLARRDALLGEIRQKLASFSCAWLSASAGCGKTHLSRLVAIELGSKWMMVRLRGLSPDAVAESIERASSEAILDPPSGIILDDFDGWANGRVQSAAESLLVLARTLALPIIITSSRLPSIQRLATWGLDKGVCCAVGDLTDDDLQSMVAGAGKNVDNWVKYVRLASGGGHPQLAHALVLALSARSWPLNELYDLPEIFGQRSAIEDVRTEIRARLHEELPEDARNLLLRLTFVLGTFDRPLAESLAQIDPGIATPGDALDFLVGPWIDTIDVDTFRVSSLVSTAGQKALGAEQAKRIHGAISNALTSGRQIAANRFDAILLHAVIGEQSEPLEKVVIATYALPSESLNALANASGTFLSWQVDHPIFPTKMETSLRLRALQVILSAATMDRSRYERAWAALIKESEALDAGSAASVKLLALTKPLFLAGFADIVPNLAKTVLSVAKFADEAGVDLSVANWVEDLNQNSTSTYASFLFAYQLTNIATMAGLSAAIDDLGRCTKDDQTHLLSAFQRPEFSMALVIKSPWSKANSSSDFQPAKAVTDYVDLARRCVTYGFQEFALAAYETAATILDENLDESAGAHAVLDEAASRLVGDSRSLIRSRARVYFHAKDYERQLALIAPVLGSFPTTESIEMAYFHRELAIASAHLGDWAGAARFFRSAFEFATRSSLPTMQIMATGLKADEAVAEWSGGQKDNCLRAIILAVQRLETTDAAGGLRSIAIHMLIRHTVMWIYNSFTNKTSEVGFEFAMVPGANSNPNPHEEIGDKPLGAIVILWYLLAELDLISGGEVGAAEYVFSSEFDSRAILFSEMMITPALFEATIEFGNFSQFDKRAARMVDLLLYMEGHPSTLPEVDILEPAKGRLPRATEAKFIENRHRVFSEVMAVVVRVTLEGKLDSLDALLLQQQTSPRAVLSRGNLDALALGNLKAKEPADASAGAIGLLIQAIRTESRPVVPELFVITLRLFEIAAYSKRTEQIAAMVLDWVSQWWIQAAETESFRFLTPQMAQTDITTTVSAASPGLRGLAEIILCANSYVSVSLGPDILRDLRKVANPA